MNCIKSKGTTLRERLLKERKDCDLSNYRCLKCASDFSSIKTLHCHMFSKHAEKRLFYKCPLCETTFVQSWCVSRHLIKVHKRTKEDAASLRIHIKSTSNTPKIQSKSQNNTISQDNLADFQRLTCLRCSRSFSSPANLRRHIAGHLGMARYWCQLCNYKSFNRSDCRDHIKRIHAVPLPHQFIITRS